MTSIDRRLRMGMVGGGRGAFIGAVHRAAARLDGEIDLVAGALSSSPEKALGSGRDLGLADDRNYPSWQAMLEGECQKPEHERIDFVSIVTPNHSHFEIASAFAEAGFHLVIDKPMVATVERAMQLGAIISSAGVICCVTYNYSGYPMVKQARQMVRSGELGEIRKVIVEYTQGWLATPLEHANQKQATWRTTPELAGPGGAIGDIGSHAEHLASYITGLEIVSLCADLNTFIPGRRLDDDASVLLRYANGARGVLIASQVCPGQRNNLRIRVWGAKAGIDWEQESPDRLRFTPIDGPQQEYHRGEAYVCEAAKAATRLPPGHPEAFIEAFANLYRGFGAAIRTQAQQASHKSHASSTRPASLLDFPAVDDGVRGVRFIDAAVRSSRQGGVWIDTGRDH